MFRIDYEALLMVLILTFFLSGCQPANNPDASDTRDGIPSMPDIELTSAELSWIGAQIFRNECAAKEACLVHWNEGEAFPSLGIGHFIWYPGGVDGPFIESFPAMIEFLTTSGVAVPDWLRALDPFDAPWQTREAMLEASNTRRINELKNFLMATRGPQAEFLVARARKALGSVVGGAPEADQASVSHRIEALISTPGGVYALIDYVNFKGEGLAETERYNGQGWGLLQVLQAMDKPGNTPALQRFREAAKRVLTLRADNAAKAIEKRRWLPGWLNRLDTYREPG